MQNAGPELTVSLSFSIAALTASKVDIVTKPNLLLLPEYLSYITYHTGNKSNIKDISIPKIQSKWQCYHLDVNH
jgi:hypothetical protein